MDKITVNFHCKTQNINQLKATKVIKKILCINRINLKQNIIQL
jgi:hypothetical protein